MRLREGAVAARAATPCPRQLGKHLFTGRAQRVHARRALGRLVVGPHQVHARRAARAAPTRPARPTRGCEWRSAASAGEDSPSPSTNARPSRAVRRSTAFTNPWPRLRAALARSTDSVDRRVVCDAVHEQELVDAEPQRRQHRGVDPVRRTVAERLDHVVERRASLHHSVGEAHRERAVAAVELQPVRLGPERAVGVGVLLEHAAHDGVGAAARVGGHRSAASARRAVPAQVVGGRHRPSARGPYTKQLERPLGASHEQAPVLRDDCSRADARVRRRALPRPPGARRPRAPGTCRCRA